LERFASARPTPASPEGSADVPSKVFTGLSWQHRSAVGVCTLPAVPSSSRRVTGEPTALLPGYGPQVAPSASASPFGAASVSGLRWVDLRAAKERGEYPRACGKRD